MRLPILLGSMLVLVSISRSQAQIQLPVYKNDGTTVQNVRFEETSGPAAFQPGRLVRVKMNGEKESAIEGIVVRVDRKSDRVYVRTKAGSPPRAFDMKQIKEIDKGVIRQAGHKEDVVMPEIQEFVIYNGAKRTVAYDAPTLSPGEIERVRELQSAENNLARLEYEARIERTSRANNVAIQADQLETRALLNELLWQQLVAYPYPYNNYLPRDYALYSTLPAAIVQEAPIYPWTSVLNYNSAAVPAGPTNVPAVANAPSSVVPPVTVDPKALAAARQRLLAAENFGVYDAHGRLVAVVVDDTK